MSSSPEPPPALTGVSSGKAVFAVLAAFGLVFLVGLWPLSHFVWLGLLAGPLLACTFLLRLPCRVLARRLATVWLLAGLVAIGWLGRPDWLPRLAGIFLKSTLAVWTISLLVQAVGFTGLCAALRRLGLPRLWTDTLGFWGRYHAILREEWHRLQLARRARTMSRSRTLKFRALTNALGLLFVRAYERAERVHRAMLARGYRELDS